MELTRSTVQVLAHLPCLSKLRIPGSILNCFSETRFDTLSTLLISNSFSGEQRGKVALRSQSLRHLEIHFCRMTRITDCWFKELPTLETLTLSKACFQDYNPSGVPQSTLRALRLAYCCEIKNFVVLLANLQDVSLRSIALVDVVDLLKSVGNLRSLAIVLKNEPLFPEALLAQIRRFGPTLEELELDGFIVGPPAIGSETPFTLLDIEQWHCTSIRLDRLRRLIVRPSTQLLGPASIMGVRGIVKLGCGLS